MSKAISIQIQGIDKLLQRMEATVNRDKVKQVVTQAIGMIASSAKHLCPVDTGNLRAKIKMMVLDIGNVVVGVVYNNCEYAMYVEFGTGVKGEGSEHPLSNKMKLAYRQDWPGQKAQPFMYPAMKQNESKIEALIAGAIGGN